MGNIQVCSKFLESVFKEDTVKKHLADKGVQWQFNLEHALWWGGAFEHMIKSTKRSLWKMVE